jgi:putative restriction endonuclease
VCSFDGRLAGNPLGLQAAHVKWHAYGGPDDVSNGLALCAFHHLALDTGALGLSDDRRIMVSCEVSGNNRLEELLYRYEGCRIKAPQPGAPVVAERFIEWHAGQVFKNPGREWPGAAGGASLAADSGRS